MLNYILTHAFTFINSCIYFYYNNIECGSNVHEKCQELIEAECSKTLARKGKGSSSTGYLIKNGVLNKQLISIDFTKI